MQDVILTKIMLVMFSCIDYKISHQHKHPPLLRHLKNPDKCGTMQVEIFIR